MNTKLFLLLMVTGCGVDTSSGTGSAGAPGVELQPRLERVGTVGSVSFDAAGYPTRIAGPAATFALAWSAGQLQQVAAQTGDQRVEAALTTSAGRVTDVDATCSGSCPRGASRHDRLAYGVNGNLATWDRGDTRWTYSYDAQDRLVAIDDGRTVATRFTYTDDGCPQLATDGATRLEYVYDDNGRIDGIATERGVTGIAYNRDGLISEFQGSAQTLAYGDGEALGLDLWPGHYVDGAPAHGELFHLDGTCDPTLRSQSTILALVVGSLR